MSRTTKPARRPNKKRRRRRPIRERPEPLGEGSVGEIYRNFFAPLVRYKPAEKDLKAYWEELFGVDTRTIQRFRATRFFRLPGLICLAPNYRVPGYGYRGVATGDVLWVRRDANNPGVDVEVHSHNLQRWFYLSETEWLAIRDNLMIEERC